MYVNEKSIGATGEETPDRPAHMSGTWRHEKRSFALENAFIAAVFQYIDLSFFTCWDDMIYEYWLRWHNLADYVTEKRNKFRFIMSGYKYFPTSFLPSLYSCICIGLIKVMENMNLDGKDVARDLWEEIRARTVLS